MDVTCDEITTGFTGLLGKLGSDYDPDCSRCQDEAASLPLSGFNPVHCESMLGQTQRKSKSKSMKNRYFLVPQWENVELVFCRRGLETTATQITLFRHENI